MDAGLSHGAEIDVQAPALIPDDYLPDVHSRLLMYKRIASADSHESLRELQVEMIDRFGLLPEPVKTLFLLMELKLKATPLGIRKIELGEAGGRVTFVEKPNIDPMRVIRLIQTRPERYKLDGKERLKLVRTLPDVASRIRAAEELLKTLVA